MASSDDLSPSSSTRGFFQAHPVLRNQLDDDEALRRAIALFIAPATFKHLQKDLSGFANTVISPQVFRWVADAERNKPYLRGDGFSALGHLAPDSLVTSEGWRALQDLGLQEGIVATGYEPEAHGDADVRVIQMLKLHLWCASSAVVACPSAMQDGAIAVLRRESARLRVQPTSTHLSSDFLAAQSRVVFARALERLQSRDPAVAWTSGQWMTERAGGSDVRGTETVASWVGPSDDAADGTDIDGNPLGPWRIDGFKWFSSATDCGVSILLAKTARGVSCFFAPTRKRMQHSDGRKTEAMNGIRIQRLKNKLGTRSLPTAELELRGMRAWLVGVEGEGVKIISAMLTITRVYNAVTAMSGLGRGLAIVRSYSAVRTFPSQPGLTLQDLPLFAKTTATTTLHYRACNMLTFFVATLLSASEHPALPASGSTHSPKHSAPAYTTGLVPDTPSAVATLLRVLTPIAKARTAKVSIAGLQECMEALGGVGYCENEENQEMNIARLYRDANVLSIWEGTTDVMTTDMIKVLKGRDSRTALSTLDNLIHHGGSEGALAAEKLKIREAWKALKQELEHKERDECLAGGREVMERLGDAVCGLLMAADASRDGDPLAIECCRRFAKDRFGSAANPVHWQEANRWDQRIAFGKDDRAREKL